MAKEKDLDVPELIEKVSREYPMAEDRFIPIGYLALDYLFGNGLPENRIVSIYSESGVGKSLFAWCVAKGVLAADDEGIVLWLDIERGATSGLLKNILGDDYLERYKNRLVVVSPDSYESAIDITQQFVKTGKLHLVVGDSLSALQTADDMKAKDEGDKIAVGKKARTEGEFLNYLKSACAASNFCSLFINQTTADFGGSSWNGPSTKMKGSKALPFFSSVIIKLQTVHSDKNDKGEFIGAMVKMTNIKNRIAGNRISYAYFRYGVGISNVRTIAEFFKWAGIVKAGGAWFTFQDDEMDFGSGIGASVKVQGTEGCNEVVKTHIVDIVDHYKGNGKLAEFFDNYVFK